MSGPLQDQIASAMSTLHRHQQRAAELQQQLRSSTASATARTAA